jgi:hypothetical protein
MVNIIVLLANVSPIRTFEGEREALGKKLSLCSCQARLITAKLKLVLVSLPSIALTKLCSLLRL